MVPSGPTAIDLAARKVDGYAFHSGWANLHDPKAAAEARAGKAAATATNTDAQPGRRPRRSKGADGAGDLSNG